MPALAFPIYYEHDLPFVTLDYVRVDTGSASTLLKTDDMEKIGLRYQPGNHIREVVGSGDSKEYVVERPVNDITIGDVQLTNFTVELGGLDYNFNINGIWGVTFFRAANAIIDFTTDHLRVG